jgi:hypothetical protein
MATVLLAIWSSLDQWSAGDEHILLIARASGRDLCYVPLTPEAYTDEQRALVACQRNGCDRSADLFEPVRSGSLASITQDVLRALGRPPPDFADYARTAATRGAWST